MNTFKTTPLLPLSGAAGIGTLAYTAPEAVDKPATPASDVWSFGIMLLEMVTGVVRPPSLPSPPPPRLTDPWPYDAHLHLNALHFSVRIHSTTFIGRIS